jgi:hypothetical protein
MGEKILVMEQLSLDMIEAGRDLVRRLDQEGVRIPTALWA